VRTTRGTLAAVTLALVAPGVVSLTSAGPSAALPDDGPATTTPIKHVVVIVGEDRSYDHYFGSYPNAANNSSSEPGFAAAAGTPASDNYVAHPNLLTANPNTNQPTRLARSQALTCAPVGWAGWCWGSR